MADPQFDYWKSEIVRTEAGGEPVDPQRQEVESLSGYWRVMAAKTKIDWPCLVHRGEGQELYTVQWGGGRPKLMSLADVDEFRGGTFLTLKAVRRLEWTAAVERGEWPDGKRALPQTAEEKHDIIPTTPASEGGNQTFDEETGEEVDPFWLQIKTKLAKLVADGTAIGKIDTLEKAEKAAKIRDDIRELGTMGEKKRVEEKTPHDEAAAAVQNKWVPVLKPALELAAGLLKAIDQFQRDEKARLEKIERDRIADEARKRLALEAEERAAQQRAEAEQRALEAEAAGQVPASEPEIVMPTADEIEAQVQQTVAETPIEVSKPVVQGTAYSRAASKATLKRGKIVDKAAFVAALLAADDPDLNACLEKRANQAAKLKFKIAGVEFIDG